LLAAQRLAEAGHRVVVYEAQATVGRKFLVAGHGGFNLTNAEALPHFTARYAAHQPRFQEFLSHFSPTDLRHWTASLGIATYVGTSGRVFPTAEYKPAQLLRAWVARLNQLGVEIRTRYRWLGFTGATGLRLRHEATGEETIMYPVATVLALGGASWSKTGSDGRWTTAFTELGIRCTPFEPSNCGAEVAWSAFFQAKVQRTPLKNIALTCGPHMVRGELMLTEYGLEGTPVYALTPAIREALSRHTPATLYLNLKPDLAPDALRQRLAQRRGDVSWASFLQKGLRLGPPVPTLLREVGPSTLPNTPEELGHLLTHVPLSVTGLRSLEEAISTAGGVAWEELNNNLMLLQRPGTFVAGEMLDWEAPTGGYLLQGCFSTGAWAAQGVISWLQSNSL
jgi:uncharacterized flavoprotein (TIGR03862 family)